MVDAIDALDADVTTVEAARSTMEVLEQLLLAAQRWICPDRLWANPDCGLKTRGEPEVIEALWNLVHAAHRVRSGWA